MKLDIYVLDIITCHHVHLEPKNNTLPNFNLLHAFICSKASNMHIETNSSLHTIFFTTFTNISLLRPRRSSHNCQGGCVDNPCVDRTLPLSCWSLMNKDQNPRFDLPLAFVNDTLTLSCWSLMHRDQLPLVGQGHD